MRRTPTATWGLACLGLLLCAGLLGLAWADQEASRWADLLQDIRPSVRAWIRDGATAAVLAEGAVLFAAILASGLVIAGLEVLRLRRERKANRTALGGRVLPMAPHKST